MQNRKDKRFREWNKVVVKSTEATDQRGAAAAINAYTYDISMRGARIYSEREYPVGSVVRLQLELVRTQQSIRIDAQVKWVTRNERENVYEMGVEFLHELSHTILSLIKHLYGEQTSLPSSMTT